MKRRTVKRGLYVREVTSTNSDDDDMREVFRSYADWLDHYVSEARQHAEKIVQSAGIDVATLFDIVRTETREDIKFYAIDREALPPEVDQALEVIKACHYAEPKLKHAEYRNALADGIGLAQAVEHLNANLVWQKPVRAGMGTSKGGRKGAKATHGPKGSKAAAYLAAYTARRVQFPVELKKDSRKSVAADFKVKPKTIERATKGH